MASLRIPLPVLVSAAGLIWAPALYAQARVLPQPGYNPPASTQIGAATANWSQITQGGNQPVFSGGFNPGPFYGGVGGYPWGGYYPGFYGNYYMDPSYGYLSGAAQVIGAQAQFMVSQQQANLMKEEVKRSQLDSRNKLFQEWRYEQGMLPTAEELRAKQEKAEVDRARNNPPAVEIWSGDALNTLLRDIQKLQGQTGSGPTVLLDPETLRHISVTDGTSFGQSQLKGAGKLEWPYPLEADFFAADRKRMERVMDQACRQAMAGQRVETKLIKEMLDTEEALRATLKQHVQELTPSQGVEARRYLSELHETIRTLQDPRASNYVSGKWAARGANVTELVANMSRDGLKFAPASSGNESYYTALYQSMVSYDRVLARVASR